MKRNGTIELEGMEFHSHHGCLEHERREGNLFTVDFKARLDLGKAAETDSLEDTLDYGRIYDIIAACGLLGDEDEINPGRRKMTVGFADYDALYARLVEA